jgi:DNA-binding NarL/FixJ family response regulator
MVDQRTMPRVLIVSDYRCFAESLAMALKETAQFEILGVVNRSDMGTAAQVQRASIVLMDQRLDSRSDVENVWQISDHNPVARIILLGLAESESDILSCAEAGASGYLLKSASLADLISTIQLASVGETVCPPHITYHLFSHLVALADRDRVTRSVRSFLLTARELEVLGQIAQKKSNAEIAARLHLSVHTVQSHVHKILCKLGVNSRLAAGLLFTQEIE